MHAKGKNESEAETLRSLQMEGSRLGMTSVSKPDLDDISWKIVEVLQANARISFSELARMLGLSPPAVAERVHRIEESGIIEGYTARINRAVLGKPLIAFVRVTVVPARYAAFTAAVHEVPDILECHHTMGAQSYIVKVAAASVEAIDAVIAQLGSFGTSETSLVLSSPIPHATVLKAEYDRS